MSGAAPAALPVSRVIARGDSMFAPGGERRYFAAGLSAFQAILRASQIRRDIIGPDAPLRDALDFGCGYGRVARFLRAGLPEATVWAADRDPDGVAFCAAQLGCRALAGLPAPGSMDLIWLGSVFTHLPIAQAEALLDRLLAALRPNGLLVFSIQGRYAHLRARAAAGPDAPARDPTYHLPREAMATICAGYEATGYGYRDYDMGSLPDYGIAFARPDWYAARCAARGARQVFLLERGYDAHQDVLGFLRLDIMAAATDPPAAAVPATASRIDFRPQLGQEYGIAALPDRDGFYAADPSGIAWLRPDAPARVHFHAPAGAARMRLRCHCITPDYPIGAIALRLEGMPIAQDAAWTAPGWCRLEAPLAGLAPGSNTLSIDPPVFHSVRHLAPGSADQRYLSVALGSLVLLG